MSDITPSSTGGRVNKPLDSIYRMIDVLETSANDLPVIDKNNSMMFQSLNQQPYIFIVLEGKMDIWRQIDNVLVETAFSPSIIGLLGAPLRFEAYYIKYSDNCKIKGLPQEEALDLIDKHHLWRDYVTYLGYLNDHKMHRDMLLLNSTSYESICMLITELDLYSPEEKATISVVDFILQRSTLSRSGVMKILSDLRYGKYIDIKHGKLVRVIKPFPVNY